MGFNLYPKLNYNKHIANTTVDAPRTIPLHTIITKLVTIYNATLRIATGCIIHTNIQHLYEETNILLLLMGARRKLYREGKVSKGPHEGSFFTRHGGPFEGSFLRVSMAAL